MMKYSFNLLLPFLFISIVAAGQNQSTNFEISRSISLNEDSKKEAIIINIDEKTVQLGLLIASTVSFGDLIIEIYDPAGEKQGNYSVGTQIKSKNTTKKSTDRAENEKKKESVHGEISKQLKHPLAGGWKVVVIPTNAKGEIVIKSSQILHE